MSRFESWAVNTLIAFWVVLFPLGVCYSAWAQTDCAHTSTSFRCVKYIRNYDADTVTFSIPNVHPLLGERAGIRVLGVDTPEMRTKEKCEKELSIKAKKWVGEELYSAKVIHIESIKRGKFFRIVGGIVYDGKSLSNGLIDRHFAVEYWGKTKEKVDWCDMKKKAEEVEKKSIIPWSDGAGYLQFNTGPDTTDTSTTKGKMPQLLLPHDAHPIMVLMEEHKGDE